MMKYFFILGTTMAKNGQAYDNKSGQWLGSLVASSGADGTIMVNIQLRMKKSIIIKGLVCSFVRPLFCPLAMLCHTNWFLFLFFSLSQSQTQPTRN